MSCGPFHRAAENRAAPSPQNKRNEKEGERERGKGGRREKVRKKEREEHTPFGSHSLPNLESDIRNFRHFRFVRTEVVNPVHTQQEGSKQRYEYMQTGDPWSHLRG